VERSPNGDYFLTFVLVKTRIHKLSLNKMTGRELERAKGFP